jgi:hypothetical protein
MYVIDQWLNGKKNYVVGCVLYRLFGKEPQVKKLLAAGETPFAREVLERKLREINKQPVVTAQVVRDSQEMPGGADPVLESLKREWLIPYQRMNYLRHNLDSIKGNTPEAIALRKPMAFEILELEQRCVQIWEKRDRYVATGTLPDVPKKELELPENPIELARLLDTVRRNITRNRGKMKQFPEEPKYALLYDRYKAQYKQITGNEYSEKN